MITIHRFAALARLAVFGSLALMLVLLTACGQVVTRPTARPTATATPSATPAPPTRIATATPDTYTPPPTATPTATPEPIIHVIKSGENLWTIAALYDVEHDLLRDVNGIENERALQIGQKLLIPVAGWGGPAEPTATPSATPLPAAVENVYFYPSPLGELTVLGEVVNTAGVDLERVVVQVALYDASDRLLASQSTAMALDALAPGQRSPFAVLFGKTPAGYASYQATVISAAPAYVGTLYRSLEPVGVTLVRASDGLVILSGRIHNTGDGKAEQVYAVATVYDRLGRVVGARSVAVQPSSFAAGSDAVFRVEIVPAGPVSTYSVQAQGRQPVPPS